jgi:hypothetical protein
MTITKNSNSQQIEHFIDERIHICLNPIFERVQLTIQKLIRYEMSFVEIHVLLILILSNTRCGAGGL